jgi:ABC-type phosphate/phosphonate transport system substrate-binding protein
MDELETVAVMINADGQTSYMAQGFVRADSGITSFAQLKGKRSCHEGLMKSCTYMPIGYGVRNNIIQDRGSLEETISSFFSAGQCAAPALCSACKDTKTDGECAVDPYNGYAGALRCIAEGAGDVALVKDDTFEVNCGAKAANKAAWCPAENEIRKIADFGRVPSHMIVAARSSSRRRALDQATIAKIRQGLIESMSCDGPLYPRAY